MIKQTHTLSAIVFRRRFNCGTQKPSGAVQRPDSFPFLVKEALFSAMQFRYPTHVPPTGRKDAEESQEHGETILVIQARLT